MRRIYNPWKEISCECGHLDLNRSSWDRTIVKRIYDKRSYEVETNQGNFQRNRVHSKNTAEQNDQFAQMESDIGKKSTVDIQPHTPVAIGVENDLSTTNSNEDQYTAAESVIMMMTMVHMKF